MESSKTLFWALFGELELDHLLVETHGGRKPELTAFVGHFMFALYLLVAVIVLLNALIAMMSDTYARIQVSERIFHFTLSSFYYK